MFLKSCHCQWWFYGRKRVLLTTFQTKTAFYIKCTIHFKSLKYIFKVFRKRPWHCSWSERAWHNCHWNLIHVVFVLNLNELFATGVDANPSCRNSYLPSSLFVKESRTIWCIHMWPVSRLISHKNIYIIALIYTLHWKIPYLCPIVFFFLIMALFLLDWLF